MSRKFASKSMFSSTMVGFETKSMINPVGKLYTSKVGNNTILLTRDELIALTAIQTLYTSKMASKEYQHIPTDFSQYLKLRNLANNSVSKHKKNAALSILFQITVDAITGAINSYGLNTSNTETKIQNLYLQKTIEEIISGVNVQNAFHETSGTLSMQQSFQLAPLFRYYIKLYGLPEPGVGFDPVKLSVVLTAMENSGIDPYR